MTEIKEPISDTCWCYPCCYKKVKKIVYSFSMSARAEDCLSNAVLENFKEIALGKTILNTIDYWEDIYGFNNFQAVKLFNLYYEWEKHWVTK